MWKQYNFQDTQKPRAKAIIAYLLFIAVIAFVTFIMVGCSSTEPKIIYKDLHCNCVNPKLDIKNEQCICDDVIF